MATRANRSVRARKLSTKANLSIIFEKDGIELVALLEEEARHLGKIVTGVEENEESEHHLQAIISGAQVDGTANIPTRDTTDSSLQYDHYYAHDFRQPATYIRFSSTVEDCVGVPYCMGDDDADFLRTFNTKKRKDSQCTEAQFETVMNFFEETAAAKQPYASIDNPPVVAFEELESAFDETLGDADRKVAHDIYEHWKYQRVKRDNQGLMASLKFEKNETSDESDPYVCFRRREIRQARKTRGRDAQVTEKLKRLRSELEQARQLVHFVKQRELHRREQMAIDSSIFAQRGKVRDTKRHLNIKGDDEDLINQKPEPKPRPTAPSGLQRAQFPGPRPLNRVDGLSLRTSDIDYPQLEDLRKKQEANIRSFVEDHINKHKSWNRGWVDSTWRPITPPLDDSPEDSDADPLGAELRGWKAVDAEAATEAIKRAGLLSPPASVASPSGEEDAAGGAEKDAPSGDAPSLNTRSHKTIPDQPLIVRSALTQANNVESPNPVRPVFRKRVGRGGRLMVDRRAPKRTYSSTFPEPPPHSGHLLASASSYNLRKQRLLSSGSEEGADAVSDTISKLATLDRFAFDNDDDDEEDEDHRARVYYTDPYDNMNIRYRIMWSRAGQEHSQAAMQAQLQRRSIAQQQAARASG